jgi:hypothetical protein
MHNNIVGDVFVPLFFVVGAAASLYIGWRFLQAKNTTLRTFGYSVICYGLAFAIWSIMIFTRTNIELITSIGVLPLIAGLFLSLYTGVQNIGSQNRSLILGGAAAYLAILFLLRVFIFPSTPGFSENGLFYFRAEPAVIAMYVGAFAAALLSATNAVSSQLKDRMFRKATQLSLTALTIGGIILVTSVNDDLQTINGWVMGLSLITLTAFSSAKKVQ